jgi:transposase
MRFVAIKSDDQLDLQSLHRVRERWVRRRTAVINQIRGFLLERGITRRKGRRYVEAALPGIVEDAEAKLSGALRSLLAQLKVKAEHTESRREALTNDRDARRRGAGRTPRGLDATAPLRYT